jgi:hypothetical protein
MRCKCLLYFLRTFSYFLRTRFALSGHFFALFRGFFALASNSVRTRFALCSNSLRTPFALCSTALRLFFDMASILLRSRPNNCRRDIEANTATHRRTCEASANNVRRRRPDMSFQRIIRHYMESDGIRESLEEFQGIVWN